jgi:hypothetical protein
MSSGLVFLDQRAKAVPGHSSGERARAERDEKQGVALQVKNGALRLYPQGSYDRLDFALFDPFDGLSRAAAKKAKNEQGLEKKRR